MMRALALVPLLGLALSGCDMLFGDDPRKGIETHSDCLNRIGPTLTHQDFQQLKNAGGIYVPTFTYDVTMLDLAAVQALAVPGSDETAGTRLMRGTNSTVAAVERFMATPVDEKGAFFLGRQPSLYRVRGKAQPASEILASGCERQKADMRLIAISWSRQGPKPADAEPAPPEPNPPVTDADQGTPTSQTDT